MATNDDHKTKPIVFHFMPDNMTLEILYRLRKMAASYQQWIRSSK